MGAATQKNASGKDEKSNVYEVACKEGLGYVILSSATTAKGYDCLTTASDKVLACRLPANADPKQAFAPILAAEGHPCSVKAARSIGGTSSGETFYEAACTDGAGYVIATSATAPAKITPCIETMDSNLECQLTTKEQILGTMSQLVAKSGKTCQVSGARYMGMEPKTGSTYYEVACGSSPGFVVQTDKAGAFMAAIDCGKAQGVGGGCKLTDVTKAETADAQNYTALAKSGGFDCNVSKYRFIGTVDQPVRSELVELACANRPDGTVALFPGDTKIKPTFIDCIEAGQFGPSATCRLSEPTPVYAKYTRELAAKGKTTCTVSGARYVGHTADGVTFIETACADGAPGWVMQVSKNQVTGVMNCAQSASAGAACKLPTNVKK
jgi:hypothetical protein